MGATHAGLGPLPERGPGSEGPGRVPRRPSEHLSPTWMQLPLLCLTALRPHSHPGQPKSLNHRLRLRETACSSCSEEKTNKAPCSAESPVPESLRETLLKATEPWSLCQPGRGEKSGQRDNSLRMHYGEELRRRRCLPVETCTLLTALSFLPTALFLPVATRIHTAAGSSAATCPGTSQAQAGSSWKKEQSQLFYKTQDPVPKRNTLFKATGH